MAYKSAMTSRILVLGLVLLSGGCLPLMLPPPSPAGAPQNSEETPEGAEAPPGAPGAARPGGPRPSAPQGTGAQEKPPARSAPSAVSVSIRNRCSKTVKVFYGQKPKFGSGTTSSLSSNSVMSHTFRPGDMFWTIDDKENGLSSVTVGENTREIEVGSDCSSLRSR